MYDFILSLFLFQGIVLFAALIGLILRGHGWFIFYLADLVTSLIIHSSAEITTSEMFRSEVEDEDEDN